MRAKHCDLQSGQGNSRWLFAWQIKGDACLRCPFLSVEDLRQRAHLGASVADMFKKQGALEELAESSQPDLFSMMGKSDQQSQTSKNLRLYTGIAAL
jgi:hypothetical protein